MAKLNHKSTVDRTGTLSLLLSSALYFALGTAAKCSMAQDCSLCEKLWWDQETWLLVPVAALWVWELPNPSGRRTAGEMVTEDAGTGHPLAWTYHTYVWKTGGENSAGIWCMGPVLVETLCTEQQREERKIKISLSSSTPGVSTHSIPYKFDFSPILILSCCYGVVFHGLTADWCWCKGRIRFVMG